MAKPTEQYRDISFLELVGYLRHLEQTYGAIAEIHVSTDEDDPRNALLCITCVGCYKLHPNPRYNTFAARKVANSRLSLVPAVLLDMLYEIDAQIEGQCPQCLAAVALLN